MPFLWIKLIIYQTKLMFRHVNLTVDFVEIQDGKYVVE